MSLKLSKFIEETVKTFRKYPFSFGISFLLFSLLVILHRQDYASAELNYFTLFCGISMVWTFFAETLKFKFRYLILFAILLIHAFWIYSLYAMKIEHNITPNVQYVKIGLNLLLGSLSFLLAYAYSKDNETFFKKILKFITDFLIAYLFTLLLSSALSITFAAIDFLFIPDHGIWEKIMWDIQLYIFFFASVFVFPVFFLTRISSGKLPELQSKLLKTFIVWIFVPFSWLYLVILYAYTLKIISMANLPSNGVASYIILFSIYALLTYLLSFPFRKEKNPLLQWIPKPYFYLLLPMLALLFFAIFLRIHSYGWTPFRYFVVAGGIFVTLVSLGILFYKKFKLIDTLRLLVLTLFITSFLPFFNAFSVSYRSQNKLVREFFATLPEDLQEKQLDYQDIEKLESRLAFLKKWYGKIDTNSIPKEYRNILTVENEYFKNFTTFSDVTITQTQNETENYHKFLQFFCKQKIFPAPVSKELGRFDIDSDEDKIKTMELQKDFYEIYLNTNVLTIHKNEQKSEIPLKNFLLSLKEKSGIKCPVMETDRYIILVKSLSIDLQNNQVLSTSVIIYEKAK